MSGRRLIDRSRPWQEIYKERLCSAEDAALTIRSGDTVMGGGAFGAAETVLNAMVDRLGKEITDIELMYCFALKPQRFLNAANNEHMHVQSFFAGPAERHCIPQGISSHVPIHLSEMPRWLEYKRPRVVAIAVTPPNEHGFMNRSVCGGFSTHRVLEQAEKVIVEINEQLPWAESEDFLLHVSQVDHIVEHGFDIIELPETPISPTVQQLAGYIADLVPDGATVQLGVGEMANAVGYSLRDKRELGLHAEIISNSTVELIKSGAVTNSRKNFFPGKSVVGYAMGNRAFYDFIDHNQDFLFAEIDFVNNPYVIARNDGIVSINSTLMVDLTGQAGSESIGTLQYSGIGGQGNFVRGAAMARNGKSILALNSTYTDQDGKKHSRITPVLPEGTVVTCQRTDVEYIVTEYGVANLRWKSAGERVKSLVNIAHPDFRAELLWRAHKESWI
ncbi:MAG: acetyl-CoA hydrolase/transferase C-terminal domain-containing protein [Syntrophomonadaceae bacterium]|nr:acetyl-CoA hydrolase/transferase C-terminal domain-containing protein [Syntrophomonadaceae bacterium]